ncbi:hypothetical protein PYW08_001403 [Mythimna loreyi]|uniref:Uncharacterized protein n=1 Tax=Mythimna loreyi TaxID=667449 RepID=A0ACC2R4T5_9NEOP|nr:hypothetical protein PYW08_001403 [Mythimna loreyi]
MDRLSHLRGEAGGSRDSTLDTTSPPSESFMTANESSSKYFSLSEVDSVDSTFDISSIKDVSLASTTTDSEGTITNADELISNLSPIGKKSDMLDSYKIGKQISAANILSGGVDIFDDNDDNSYDGDELVIDDNVDDKSNLELKQSEEMEFKSDENMIDSTTTLINEEADIASKDTEVVLQIDGKNVDAIDIGNGLYLYRKEGQEELAAVQIIDDDQQQTSIKFLKVRENVEGNLEVYEEIEIEVPKEVPAKEGKLADKKISSHVPIKDINKVISESACNKVAERKIQTPRKEPILSTKITEVELEVKKEPSPEGKSEVNINGKMMKFSESRKSPVIGSFTPMTYHSTPNKEPRPLTKTMVDQQLHPNRHSDNVKKTIEVHTDSCKQRTPETPTKNKDDDDCKTNEMSESPEKVLVIDETVEKVIEAEETEKESVEVKNIDTDVSKPLEKSTDEVLKENPVPNDTSIPIEQHNIIDSTEKDATKEKSIFTENIQTEIVNEEKNEEMSRPIDDIEESMDEDLVIVETDVETEVDKDENKSEELIKTTEDEPKTDDLLNSEKSETNTEKLIEVIESESQSKDLVKVDKNEVKPEELVKADDDNQAKIHEDVQKSQPEVITSEPIQVVNKVVEIDVTDNNDKAIVKDNTQCDSQDETKVEEIIYDISDQDNDEIIIIDDSELDETRIIETTATDDKDEADDENSNGNDQEKDTNIAKKIENETKIKENVQDNKTAPENIQTKLNSAVIFDMPKEQMKKPEASPFAEMVKNNQSKIPIAKPDTNKEMAKQDTNKEINKPDTNKETVKPGTNKEINKPDTNKEITKPDTNKEVFKPAANSKEILIAKPSTLVDFKVGQVASKPEPTKDTDKESKSELKPEPSKETSIAIKEFSKDNRNKELSPAPGIPQELQKPVKDQKNPPLPEAAPLRLNKTPIHISPPIAKIEKPLLKKENNMLEKSPKKEAKKSIPIAESQFKVLPMEVDSTTNVKVDASRKSSASSDKVIIKDVKEQKPNTQEASGSSSELKRQLVNKKDEKQEIQITPKASTSREVNVKDVKVSPVPKEEQPSCSGTQDVSSTSTDSPNDNRNEGEDDSEEPKPGGSKKAVPFGKWTATNRKEFLDKIKNRNTVVTPAVPSTSSNQLKNSNDLNRRDVLQKIDSQRQQSSNAAALAKTQEGNKANKNETAFVSKASISQSKDNNTQESKIPLKVETAKETSEPVAAKAPVKSNIPNDSHNEDVSQAAVATSLKKDAQRTEVNYQDLIDKTIEDMIHRTVGSSKPGQDEPNQNSAKDCNAPPTGKFPANYQPTDQATLDEIEMKMNELHGIPFIERPPHELPVVPLAEPKPKTYTKADKEKPTLIKSTKIPNLLPFANKIQQKITKENIIEVDSEDEIIEHEPITGDIDINKKSVAAKLPPKEKALSYATTDKSNSDAGKIEPIITEKDFDKFARRNSITYENCLTMNFDSKDSHNVVQKVVEKDPYPKTYSRNDVARVDPKSKMAHKYQNVRQPVQPVKVHPPNKLGSAEDSSSRNQSKLQKAYQSALSAKRQKECPITIIEDKPVKVVFMDNMEFVPSSLNIQGQQLSPAKKLVTEPDNFTLSTLDSLDSDALDSTDDAKCLEEVKTKTKHQRKQVLTPVDEPELELIEPKDLGLEVSPKKKRKTEDDKTDKNLKYPVRKKYYLLGSNTTAEDKFTHTEVIKNPLKETVNRNDNGVAHKNTVSAIDSLVKAAELLEHSENLNIIDSPTPDSQQSTPVKRGRGRPRKYPLPEGAVPDKNKVPSPQKKPRLIDAKVPKRDPVTTDDDDDDEDSDGQIIKENWTMGKINENIVCPICNKLFRTENVVFKHVKHCTGPSPSRSGSDKRSPRRMRPSQESDSKSQGSKSDDMDLDDDKPLVVRKETPKKRKSKDSVSKSEDKDDVIVIEDTPPVKDKAEKREKEVDDRKIHESRKPRAKIFPKTNDLICEFCGKTFRQLSYLVSHKLQHKKDDPKKVEIEAPVASKTVYSCEVCKKEFRKLHHLVQHRIIHNPSSEPARSLRKSSSEHSDTKIEKEPGTSKLSEDPSAGFRCEPCDKSFRKLHHLVEHRETHDGINRQKTTPAVVPNNVEKIEKVEKPVTLHQCEVCKKTFRKLHHLIEHKEQHVETSSEKSDDKSVKSSLSTRDIIHECSLCYMVFPNEHSLNKHTIICQRKKRQSKQAKPAEECEATAELVEDASENPKIEEKLDDIDSPKLVIIEDIKEDEHKMEVVENIELPKEIPKAAAELPVDVIKEIEKEVEPLPQKMDVNPVEPPVTPTKRDFSETVVFKAEVKPEVPEKIKKVEIKETNKVHETPKKKISNKEKSTSSASKRLKTTVPVAVPEDPKPAVESSDDDEVRYMLNPNFKVEEPAEEKVFMKVRANKRSSLQIERPNSKDLVKRRTSLQHPPKIPRLKPKAVEPNPVAVKQVAKAPKLEPVPSTPSTDSDDSDTVKYSFPKTIPEKATKPAQERTPKTIEKKIVKKTLADKRKSLSGIAKRKSLGKVVTAKHKPSPMKQIKRRTLEVEHRCDCGQLFSSAALLARHTSLAHTPPRIRRRRSPAPDEPVTKPASQLASKPAGEATSKPASKPASEPVSKAAASKPASEAAGKAASKAAPRKSSVTDKPKQAPAKRKSSARSDSSASTNTKPNKSETKPTRKSLDKETKTPAATRKPKPEKSEAKSSIKPKRTPAHRGVPVPEKMRKLMQKNNK